MTAPRTAGQLGALAPVFPVGLGDLSDYLTGALPKPPAEVHAPDLNWGMDGNDTKGDCGPAGLNHLMMAAAADTKDAESFPTADQVVAYYLTYTGGQDTGVVLSQYLAYVRAHGFYSHSVKAFAPVKVHDLAMIKTAVYLFDGVYAGIVVTQAMQEAFAAHKPWTTESLKPPVLGGHCVPIVGYDADYLYIVTWGGIQKIEYAAWHYMSSEAWAVMTGELAKGDGHGINEAALTADLDRLDSSSFRLSSATVGLAPAIVAHHVAARLDALVDEVAYEIRTVAASGKKDVTELVAWLASHGR